MREKPEIGDEEQKLKELSDLFPCINKWGLQTKLIVTIAILGLGGFLLLWRGFNWSEPQTFEDKKEFMKLVAQAITGIVVIIGLQLTYHSVKTSQENTRLTQRTVRNASEQLQIDRDTKIADLFYKASEQLGDKDSPQRRIAGLYSLQKLSKEHEEDYCHQCIDVIVAFIQSTFRVEPLLGHLPEHYVAPTDLTVAVSILCERQLAYKAGEDKPMRFGGVDFRGVEFREGDFCGARFIGCDFAESLLVDSRFSACFFEKCNFNRAVWSQTDFRGTTFVGGANKGLDLRYADFIPDFKTEATYHAHNPQNLSKDEVSFRLRKSRDPTKAGYELIHNIVVAQEGLGERIRIGKLMATEEGRKQLVWVPVESKQDDS